MDATKLHLILNYYPAIALVISTLLLIVAYWRKSERLMTAVMKLFIGIAVFTFPVFVTGEIAGGSDGVYTGMTAENLNRHKALARPAFLMIEATGGGALFSLFLMGRAHRRAGWATTMALVLAIFSSGVIVGTIHLGRQIKWASMPPAVNSKR